MLQASARLEFARTLRWSPAKPQPIPRTRNVSEGISVSMLRACGNPFAKRFRHDGWHSALPSQPTAEAVGFVGSQCSRSRFSYSF
jgi:hypothetical protein